MKCWKIGGGSEGSAKRNSPVKRRSNSNSWGNSGSECIFSHLRKIFRSRFGKISVFPKDFRLWPGVGRVVARMDFWTKIEKNQKIWIFDLGSEMHQNGKGTCSLVVFEVFWCAFCDFCHQRYGPICRVWLVVRRGSLSKAALKIEWKVVSTEGSKE